MKRFLAGCCLVLGFISNVALADATQELKSRLAQVNSFHANFTQTVTSNGAYVQQGSGELWVKRPNLFNWHMSAPDESQLISDGRTVWFYNPFVEQVTATTLSRATSNTPFMLIARNSSSDWQQYNITQSGGDEFTLTPKGNSGNMREVKINVSSNGIIRSFEAVEGDGQRTVYRLSGQQNGSVDAAKFSFKVPSGATLDDQR